jgi:Uma2 family endonuclease
MDPEEVSRMSEPAVKLPHAAPYTVDDLFEMPDDGNRYEVLGGSLVVSPAPRPIHQLAADELRLLLRNASPQGVTAITATAVRISAFDGPVPDIVVTDADLRAAGRELPAGRVHTVVEVVSPSNALVDRAYKRELYAEAGIPCYWRVELEPWRGYTGELPLVVVRLLTPDGWQTFEAAAGQEASLPMAVGRLDGDKIATADVRFDPAVLIDF